MQAQMQVQNSAEITAITNAMQQDCGRKRHGLGNNNYGQQQLQQYTCTLPPSVHPYRQMMQQPHTQHQQGRNLHQPATIHPPHPPVQPPGHLSNVVAGFNLQRFNQCMNQQYFQQRNQQQWNGKQQQHQQQQPCVPRYFCKNLDYCWAHGYAVTYDHHSWMITNPVHGHHPSTWEPVKCNEVEHHMRQSARVATGCVPVWG